MAVLIASAMFALVALILLAVQVGTIGTFRALLQGSADQAALAGAQQLNGTSEGLSGARIEAIRILEGGKNFPIALNDGSDLSIAGDAFETGIWDLEHPEQGFTPSSDPDVVNAVRVRGRKTGALNGPIKMFLGGSFGPDTVELSRTGIAATGNCAALPCRPELPIAACQEDLECGEKIELVKSPSTEDNSAWTGYFDDNPNANGLRALVRDCSLIPNIRQGDCISLNTGEVNSALMALRDKFHDFLTAHPCPNVRIPDEEFPGCAICGANVGPDPIDINGDGLVDDDDCGMASAIPLVPCSGSIGNSCTGDPDTNGSLNQERQVSRFVLFVITGVKAQGSPKYVEGYPLCGIRFPDAPTGPGPSCSPSSPSCCATEPVLVNKDLRS